MHNHNRLKTLFAIVMIAISAFALWQWQTRPATAAGQVESAWGNVRRSDSYAFTADVEMETIPLPTVGNIGRFSKKDGLYLEGQNNRRDETLQLALWGGPVSAADPAAAYHVRVVDGRVQTRAGDEAWQDGSTADVAFAPAGDFLAFLDFAKDIAYLGEANESGQNVSKYSFIIDGPAYANHMRTLSQQRLVAEGSIPAGVALESPAHLAEMNARGELWVDARGLPVRQIVRLEMPPAAGADYRTNADMTIYFRDYQGVDLAVNWWQPLRTAGFALSQIEWPSATVAGANAGILLATLLLVVGLVRLRVNRRVLVVVNSALLAIIVLTPLAHVGTASAAAAKLATYYEDNAITPPDPVGDAAVAAGLAADPTAGFDIAQLLAPRQPRVPLASVNLQAGTLDTDGDGLTDEVEAQIGTNPYRRDSDSDTITDDVEVAGFLVGSTRWYGNPLAADTNGDGVIDGYEWNPAAPDSDGDGTPDLHDWDDDNDGVPDSVDLSRVVGSVDDGGQAITFTNANPLVFTLDGLQPGSIAYATLQLRPTDPQRLWYAFNVLNWPKDEKGNMQDWDGMTMFDHCQRVGGTDCRMSPDANGDIKFVPMLEVSVRDRASLPRLANGQPDEALMARYGMALQPNGDGSYLIYVPLNVVHEVATGNKVAFEARMIYEAGATFAPQQMRLVWAVHVLQEQYADADEFNAAKKNGQVALNNKATILHAYYDDFVLTGLNVREDRGVQMAIMYEDPAADLAINEDGPLLHMTMGLRKTYLLNRDCDFVDNAGQCVGDGRRDITIPVLKRRWDKDSNAGITSGQRWGIEPDKLRVETYSFRHEDEAIVIGGSERAAAILNARFKNTAARMPTLLFVRESSYKALNIAGREPGGPISWQGRALRLSMAQEPLITSAAFNTAHYMWDSAQNKFRAATNSEVVSEVEARYEPLTAPDRAADSNALDSSDIFNVSVVMVVNTQGESAVIATNNVSPLGGMFDHAGKKLTRPPDFTDDRLRTSYALSIVNIAQMGPLVVRIANRPISGSLPVFNKTNTTLKIAGFKKLSISMLTDFQNPIDFTDVETANKAFRESDEHYKWAALDNAPDRLSQTLNILGSGLMLAGALSFILSFFKGAQTVGHLGLAAVGAISAIVTAVTTIIDVVQITTNSFVQVGLKATPLLALRFSYSLNSSAGKAGALGAVIGGVISWGLFFVAWAQGGLSPDSIEFNTLLAGAIATTLVIVVTFLISLTVVGAIVLAIVAVFDLFALIICKIGVKVACKVGIMENITRALTQWLYSGEIMIDTQDKANPIVNIEDLSLQLTNPAQGLVVGNSVRFNARVWTNVRHNVPTPSTVYHFDNFYTPEDLASTTVRYSLTNFENKQDKARLGQSSWWNVRNYSSVTSEAPVPILGWLGGTIATKYLYEGYKRDWFGSPVYNFTQAGINTQFPVYFNTHMALPRYDCWFGFCAHKSVSVTNSENLGNKYILDVLPNTLDGFYWWTALGSQVDRDGDGLIVTVDTDDSRYDRDGDGLNDAKERAIGSDPSKADADGDGLSDLEEARYGTPPNAADADGDGISDAEEIRGYPLTINGQTVWAFSDPLLRDSDNDGISDGAERRLNVLSPTAYPFHPAAFNESPAALYVDSDDFDNVVAVGQALVVTTTVRNNTRLQDNLLATGTANAQMPAGLGSANGTLSFALLPGTQDDIVLSGSAVSGQRFVTVTTDITANLVPYSTPAPRTPAADIENETPLRVIIDNDNPHEPTLILGNFVQPDYSVIIGGTASDPTSYVRRVDVSVAGSAYLTATGRALWAFAVDIPDQPTGSVPISVRVTDAVGNQTTKAFDLTIDSVPPVSSVDLDAGDVRRVRRNAQNAWSLDLSGSASDALAGLGTITLSVDGNANVDVPEEAIDANGNWTFSYPFDDIGTNAQPNPTGSYTLTVTTTDLAEPEGNPVVQVIPFVIDMTPPTVELLSHRDDDLISDNAVISGTVSDAHTSVASVEYAFVPADVVFATAATLLDLPLNDIPKTVQFGNLSNESTRYFCLDESCPTSGMEGVDGTAARFDGNDLLRNFEPLPIGAADTSIALWFKTTCANCGLFSVVQGSYPDQTQHDRDLFLVGGTVCVGLGAETRCTQANSFADGEWHHVVHTLGANGHNLYLDGTLAVSSPTTASPLSGMDGALVGYSAAAGTPFLTGDLDAVTIYAADLSAGAATHLYRPWTAATLNPDNSWSFSVPDGLEGYYQIDMRAADNVGNRVEVRGDWPQYRGPIDTALPTFEVSAGYSGSGSAAQTRYSASVRDRNLTTDDYSFVCTPANRALRYAADPAFASFAGGDARQSLAAIDAQCLLAGYQSTLVSVYGCDIYGHCGAATPPQTVAYIGTRLNTLNPFGTLPNAIERVNLSDPTNAVGDQRLRLIERPGRYIFDIEVDQAGGKLYWSEAPDALDQANAGEIWRANLDGSNPQRIAFGQPSNLPEMLQIAVDTVGNKIYWTRANELWWANLDGSLAGAVYTIPADPRVAGPDSYQSIGDVVVDQTNRKLFISERRNRFRQSNSLFVHSLIVELGLNGSNPAFVWGVRDGCTYANWNDNLGTGVGPGQKPDTCLMPNGGMDVEGMTVADGVLYWAAYDELDGVITDGLFVSNRPNGKNPAVYRKQPGQPAQTVAPLALLGPNNLGLNFGPVPHLYVNAATGGVFVQHGAQIVRGEPGGAFTVFTTFRDETPAPVGTTKRGSSELTALAVVEVAGAVYTETDLRVEIKSRDLVLLDGDSGSYNVTARNVSALPAPDAELTLDLPAGATFGGSVGGDASCSAVDTRVTCALGTLAPFSERALTLNFSIASDSVRTLSATAAISSSAPESNSADNSATFANITAAPTLTALPGTPYLYYMADMTQLVRVPLFGNDHTPQPVLFEGRGAADYIGTAHAMAASADGQSLYLFDPNANLQATDAQGGNRQVLANAYPTNPFGDGGGRNLAVAVNPTDGRLFYTEQVSTFWSRIRSINADGSDAQTINERVLLINSLAVDPLRGKLYWIATDNAMRRHLIYRSNLDGSQVEVVYSAPDGEALRDLAIDPFAQTLYWVNPTYAGGAIMRARSDGQQVVAISLLGDAPRGLVVRPEQDAIYYSAWDTLFRNTLDGSNEESLTNLNSGRVSAVSNLDPATLYWARIRPPRSNLVYAIGAPFAPATCVTADSNEPNDSAAGATSVAAGTLTGALCRPALDAAQDVDFYQISVPSGQRLEATLRNLPANYDLQIRQADGIIATSSNAGTADETAAANNYSAQPRTYSVIVFAALAANNATPYTLDLALTAAPPQTEFLNEQCQAVDTHEMTPQTGNGSQGSATPLTLGQAITGALCFNLDSDYYSFSGTNGQTVLIDLTTTAAGHSFHVYRPDGSFLNAFNANAPGTAGGVQTLRLDADGTWAVAVSNQPATPTLTQYQLLVSDGTCGVNDAYEPNDIATLATAIDATPRVFATLCSATDSDLYTLNGTAGQQLTIDYPMTAAGGELSLNTPAGQPLGRVRPGAGATFTLPATGSYRLSVANSALGSGDTPYSFVWRFDVAQPTGAPYLYFGNYPHLARVALSADHAIMPIYVDGGGFAANNLVSVPTLDRLYMADLSGALFGVAPDGFGKQALPFDANPNDSPTTSLVAVDPIGGKIYWTEAVVAAPTSASRLMVANLDGSGAPTNLLGAPITDRAGLAADPLRGELLWIAADAIWLRDRSGNVSTLRAAVAGQTPRDLTLDALARMLYWIDTTQGTLVRRSLLDGTETTLVSGLNNNPRGIVVRSDFNDLYYSNGATLFRAALDGSGAVAIATLSGQRYEGPSNLDPNVSPVEYLFPPDTNLVLAYGAPIASACALADGNEPNNTPATATALNVISKTVVSAALCYPVGTPFTTPDFDYYAVELAPGKQLTATLDQLPADYRLVIVHPANYAAAFSDNSGLTAESGVVSNLGATSMTYHVLVLTGSFNMTPLPYRLTLAVGDPPPPPNPDDAACSAVDPYDAPAPGGNGTLGSATPLAFGNAYVAALCYANDIDMYAFQGVAGQTVQIDLPTRPADYTLTLYDPAGDVHTTIDGTTTPGYGDALVLPAGGTWTVAVSKPAALGSTDQYALVVSDGNCVASDPHELNDSAATAAPLTPGSAVRATLCGDADRDFYTFSAAAGDITLSYPANATGATLRLFAAAAPDVALANIAAGTQAVVALPAAGDYVLELHNPALTARDVPYLLHVRAGAAGVPAGTPYLYSNATTHLNRASVISGTVEPILLSGGGGALALAAHPNGKLYLRSYDNEIVSVNPDGTDYNVLADADPVDRFRFPPVLAIDEQSGQIYWSELRFGVVSRIVRANSDGSDKQEVIETVVGEEGLVVDAIGGYLYWAEHRLWNGAVRDVIGRSNLDGSDQRVVYAAPEGRFIRELALDPLARMLYWRDPSQQSLLWVAAEGGEARLLLALGQDGRGLVVRPQENTIYFSAGESVRRANLDGSDVREIARQSGRYTGVSNLDPNAFYPTTLVAPQSNLALAYGTPFAAPCAPLDQLEPNNTADTAATISAGTFSAALCTVDLDNVDQFDFYKVNVADGKQISVTLTNVAADYVVVLSSAFGWETSRNGSGPNPAATLINRSGSAADALVIVLRDGGVDTQPYTLTVAITDAPPPPPPPPPPADVCAEFDAYDAPGYAGNWNRDQATQITYNTPITAALCYAADKDYYSWDGLRGEDVQIVLDPRPFDYYITIYGPDGGYLNGIFPGAWLDYGDTISLAADGRYTLVVWYPETAGTTAQYRLQLNSTPSDCLGQDPFEPNNQYYSNATLVLTRTLTLAQELCKADDEGGSNDTDSYRFPLVVGEKIIITPRQVVPGVSVGVNLPNGTYGGDLEANETYEYVTNSDGDFTLLIYIYGGVDLGDNLPYIIDVQIEDAPPPPTRQNNWACSLYDSGVISVPVGDFETASSSLTVPVSGTLTYVALHDLTFAHDLRSDLAIGLQAPDGTAAVVLGQTYGAADWCGDHDGGYCRLSLEDRAQAGLQIPAFPRGGVYQPTHDAFALFNGLNPQGAWSLVLTDLSPSMPGDEIFSDGGELARWALEVCVDNGQPYVPPPPPADDAPPLPGDDTPPGNTDTNTPTDTPTSCVLPAADGYEADNTPATASLFDYATGVSSNHTFHSLLDVDWIAFGADPTLDYSFASVNVGGNAQVRMALFAPDGVTQIASGAGALSFSPTVSGTHYLRLLWAGGLRQPCGSEYHVTLQVSDPNAVPVPDPVGPPVPPTHTPPVASAAVLRPADGSVVTATATLDVEIGLATDEAAVGNIAAASFLVNGVAVDNFNPTRRAAEFDVYWQTTWTPSAAGAYLLTAVVTATDGTTATSPISTFYVDLAAPTVTLVNETVTQPLLRPDGSYLLHGTASDDSKLLRVEVRVDGGDWQVADLVGSDWALPFAPQAAANPDGGSVAVDVRAIDVAGNTAGDSATLTVDIIGPAVFALTTQLQSGAPISATAITTDLATRLGWPALADANTLAVGWSSSPTATLAGLTSVAVGGGTRDSTQGEASVRYAHAIATDAQGNQTVVTRGPFYFDTPATPDLVGDLALTNWPDSGGKQIGRQPGTPFGDQALFAGWDANNLRLRWQGFDVDGGGDVAFYFGTGAAGATSLVTGGAQTLPFTAAYAIVVTSDVTATLYSGAGGSWSAVAPVALAATPSAVDVVLPWGALGLGSPRAAGLQLLAVATHEGSAAVWATMPDKNAAFNQYIEWPTLGGGIVPAAGVWADAQISAQISAQPAPNAALGAGDSITLTVAISNSGSAPLPSLTIDGSTTGGLTLSDAPQSVSNLAAGGRVTVTLNATINLTGTLSLTLADSYHRPYALGTLSYTVDTQPPVSVTVDLAFVGGMTNTITAAAVDASALASFEVEIDGPTRAAGGRAPVNVVCDPAGDGSFVCRWNAGSVSEGQTFQLRGRATDVHGNTSAWSLPVDAPVDTTPPVLALSAESQAFVADGKLNANELLLGGTLTDLAAGGPGLPVAVQLCADSPALPCITASVAADGSWQLNVPVDGTEYSATLTLIGSDAANNDSAPLNLPLFIDVQAPRFSNTSVTRLITEGTTPVAFASGDVTDGDTVQVRVLLLAPNATVSDVAATTSRAGWSASATFAQAGNYQALFVATDAAGNTTTVFGGNIQASGDPNAVELVAFDAQLQPTGDVLVTWETASEIDAAGFNVYRARPGDALGAPLNGALIAALGSNGLGDAYDYLDAAPPGGTWAYWLEALDTNGQRELFGPLAVEVTDPTAVALAGQAVAGLPVGGLLAVGAALLLTAWLVVWRRRSS